MQKDKIKYLLFSLLMAILIFPMAFQPLEGTITYKLKGYNKPPKKVDFSAATFLDGSWQSYLDAYSKESLQVRHFLIRLNNQIKYSLFDHLNARYIERGKNDYFFENWYVTSYLGLTFKGEDYVEQKVSEFQELKDTLAAHDIKMLFVIAAGKANYMPENIPKKYNDIEKGPNNYEAYAKYLSQSTIPYLDFNKYLVDMKDTASYPLFTKGNTHWSFYAISFITDSLIRTIEKELGKDLPDYNRKPVEISYKPSYYTEDGIYQSLNLYWTEMADTFAYRHPIYTDTLTNKDKYRPNIWVIGDSFYGTLETYKVPQNYFDPSSIFFYYNKQIVGTRKNKKYTYAKIKRYIKQIKDVDMIIFWSADSAIPACPWGAEKTIMDYYKRENG